jgi:hypothetical protein
VSKFEDKYSLPDTVEICMEDATFHVRLPTSANRKYERAVAACMVERDPESGIFQMKDFEMHDLFTAQHYAFLRSCVVSADGIEFDAKEFLDRFPDAAEDLYNKAVTMAEEVEKEALDAAGKSQDTLTGQDDGKEKKTSTPVLSRQAG